MKTKAPSFQIRKVHQKSKWHQAAQGFYGRLGADATGLKTKPISLPITSY